MVPGEDVNKTELQVTLNFESENVVGVLLNTKRGKDNLHSLEDLISLLLVLAAHFQLHSAFLKRTCNTCKWMQLKAL